MNARYPRAQARRSSGAASRPELAFRAWLTLAMQAGSVLWWKEQPCSIKLATDLHYRPDFLHTEADTGFAVFTELKQADRHTGAALTTEKSWAKLKMAAELLPIFVFRRATWNRQTGHFTIEDIPGGTL